MNSLIYGSNPEERIIAVDQTGDNIVTLYERVNGEIIQKEANFYPFFFLSNMVYLKNFIHRHWIKELSGSGYFRYLVAFSNWSEMWNGVNYALNRYNENAPFKVNNYFDLPVLHLVTDPVSQFLMQTGMTLFKGMAFEELHRAQIQIKYYSSGPFKEKNPMRPDDKIVVIALADNRGFSKCLHARRKTEKQLLTEFVEIIRELDPDLIEGHNILNHGLPYIAARAQLSGVELSLGRNKSVPRFIENKFPSQERTTEYFSIDIDGRQVVDILNLVQYHADWRKTVPDLSLKSISARLETPAVKGREYLSQKQVSALWDSEPEKVIADCQFDSEEIGSLSAALSPRVFALSQILPMNYDTVSRTSLSNKVELIALREYIRVKHSLPKISFGETSAKLFEEIFRQGIFSPVISLDFEAIIPSVILSDKIPLKNDELNIFPLILRELEKIRSAGGEAASPAERLLSSFYQYYGNSRGLFGDSAAFETLVKRCNEIINDLARLLTKRGAEPLIIDSGRVYLIPPPGEPAADQRLFLERLSKEIPFGDKLSIADSFKKILTFKKHNFALLTAEGKVEFKGPSLASRGSEPFLRQFLRQVTEELLRNDLARVHSLYAECRENIIAHKIPMSMLAKTDILRDSPDEYEKSAAMGKRNRLMGYEVAIANGVRWKSGDAISYYVSLNVKGEKEVDFLKPANLWDGDSPDDDKLHYLKKLDEFSRRFDFLFDDKDFQRIFSENDLFGVRPEEIMLKSQSVGSVVKKAVAEDDDGYFSEPTIWIAEDL